MAERVVAMLRCCLESSVVHFRSEVHGGGAVALALGVALAAAVPQRRRRLAQPELAQRRHRLPPPAARPEPPLRAKLPLDAWLIAYWSYTLQRITAITTLLSINASRWNSFRILSPSTP